MINVNLLKEFRREADLIKLQKGEEEMPKAKKVMTPEENFKQAVRAYRNAVIEGYYLPHGEDADTETPMKNMKKFFRKLSRESRSVMLYFAVRHLMKNARYLTSDEDVAVSRLNGWLKELANELADKLEKIK